MIVSRASAAFAGLPNPVRGAILAITASAFFAGMIGCIRTLSDDLPPLEIVLFRNLFSFAFMVPWLLMSGLSVLRTSHHKLYLGRSMIGFVSMCLWFTGVAYLPLNESTALSFTAPLFASVGAVIFLGEVIRLRRWTATIIGFLGTMIILRPGLVELTWPQIVILMSAVTSGINAVMVKQLTRTESPNAIVTYMTLYALPFSLVAASFVWVTPPVHTWPIILLLGFFATIGHLCLTRAFVCMDASSVTALDFSRLPFVALIAWFAFGEAPDIWTWMGAAVIVSATVYITHREAVVARAQARSIPTMPVAIAASRERGTIATTGVSNPKPPGNAQPRAADD
jgi:drug/metabolite transporter (DMT)-like permease